MVRCCVLLELNPCREGLGASRTRIWLQVFCSTCTFLAAFVIFLAWLSRFQAVCIGRNRSAEAPAAVVQHLNALLLDVDGWHVLSSSYCPVGPLESTRWRFNPSAYLSFRRWKSCRHDEGWVIDLLLQFPLMASMKQLWRLPSLKHSHNYIGHTSRRCPSRFHRYIHCRTHIVLLFKQMAQSSRQERSKWQWNNIKNTAVLVSHCCKYAPKTLEFQRWP